MFRRNRAETSASNFFCHESAFLPGFLAFTDMDGLRVHMTHLREKIEADPSRPEFLITEPGIGYRLKDNV